MNRYFGRYMYAVRAQGGALVWRFITDAIIFGSPSVSPYDGAVYIVTNGGTMYKWNAAGALLWSVPLDPQGAYSAGSQPVAL
jgi:outer membrane protein assembly factor BamB